MINPYWALYARIFRLAICRSCGAILDRDYKKRRRGKLCTKCKVADELKAVGIRTELTEANETLGKRIREGEIQKIPYLLIVGEKEKKTATVAVRKRGKGDMGAIKLSTFIKSLNAEIIKRK